MYFCCTREEYAGVRQGDTWESSLSVSIDIMPHDNIINALSCLLHVPFDLLSSLQCNPGNKASHPVSPSTAINI